MGKIKEIYIQLKREYPMWDERDIPYLFEQYVRNMDKPQKCFKPVEKRHKKPCKLNK